MIPANLPADPRIHDTASKIAVRCRNVIQACLREEEWADADREFYMIARDILEEAERCKTASKNA